MSDSNRQEREAGTRPVYAGVLVGGASTRMGQSKASLQHEGQRFVERVVAAVAGRVERVVLLGNEGCVSDVPGTARVPDVPGLVGPLAGIVAAQRWAPSACWLIVACDLPLLREEAVDWLLSQRGPDRWAILPRTDQAGVEPLLAVYEPEAVALVEQLAARNVRSPRSLADLPHVHTPRPPAALRACWTNVNTPADLERLARANGPPLTA